MSTPQRTRSALSDRARRRLAWAAPVVVAGGIAATVAIANAQSSSATPTLPSITAKQLLTDVQTKAASAFSGEVHEVANLGLPDLAGSQSRASLSPQSFLIGSHDVKVWVDGADKQRAALLGQLSEADVVHNGKDLWTYTSDTNTVTHTVLPSARHRAGSAPRHSTPPGSQTYSPAAVAAEVLKAIRPSTKVSVDAAATVAGRPAYTLVLAPRDSRSTVREVRIAVDATKFLPLRVQVFGQGSAPAFEVGFSSISFATPAAGTFDFTQPKGAVVSKNPFTPSRSEGRHHHGSVPPPARTKPASGSARSAGTKVLGSGWTSVLELGNLSKSGLGGTVDRLTTPVGSSGARLLHTALVNVVLLADGRAFVGAVSPAYLEHVAATAR